MLKKRLFILILPCLLIGTIKPTSKLPSWKKGLVQLLERKKVPVQLPEVSLPQTPATTLTDNFTKTLNPTSGNGLQRLWQTINTSHPELGTGIAKVTVTGAGIGLIYALYKISKYCETHKHTKSEKLFRWGYRIAALATTMVAVNYYA